MSCQRRNPRRGINFQLGSNEVHEAENVVVVLEGSNENQSILIDNNTNLNDSSEIRITEEKCNSESQTTPGLMKNGIPMNEDGKDIREDSIDEEQSCPVCFEEWTNSGKHRLCSLNCGHLFGRSCIERWIKEQRNKNCPQCKHPSKLKDIRNIYAKHLKVLDTTDRDQAQKELIEERYRRSRAEENEAKALLQCQLLRAEMERLRREVEKQTSSCSTSSSRNSNQSSVFIANSQDMCPLRQPLATVSSSHISSSRAFVFQKTLQVSTKEARTLAFDKSNMMITVSKPSPNQLFKGYGVLKVSSLDSRCSEFISIHQNVIRDSKFNNTCDRLLLTASTDKTIKVSNMLSNSVVISYNCPGPVWACGWNETNTNIIYAGIQNGECCIYDIRQTNEMLMSIRPRFGAYPIVSLSYVPASEESLSMCCEGVLFGTLQGGWFMHKDDVHNYSDRQLLFPEGSSFGLYFEPKTRYCMLSQRPSKKTSRVTHMICSLSGDGSENNPIRTNLVQQCYGGCSAQSLTRSCIFPNPDDPTQLMVCAGDESSSSVIVWDGLRGKQMQTLTNAGGTVFDVLSFQAHDSNFLASLTETKLSFYKWQ
ncbi:E3 ubiquitin-protein ligase rfwd3.S-like [Hydra vulgaris]|uniref:RING-type E3 ubiquitin transferase n=1 Tax=Hydra vulgaris TaxID=6087 RepID=A0ABM4BX18_HYDVU